MVVNMINTNGGVMDKDQLALAIKAAGVTRRDVARAAGVSGGNVTYWLRGRHKIPEDKVQQIEAFLNEKAKQRAEDIRKTFGEVNEDCLQDLVA